MRTLIKKYWFLLAALVAAIVVIKRNAAAVPAAVPATTQTSGSYNPNRLSELGAIVRTMFQGVFGRVPTATELFEWSNKALAAEKSGQSATSMIATSFENLATSGYK